MKVKILENYERMSKETANHIIEQVKIKPDSLLCLAGGDTPLKTYEYLVEAEREGKVDFSKCKFVSLDEWVGLDKSTKGSCIETLYNQLYNKLNINIESQVCFFNGVAENLSDECNRVDKFIFDSGKIDLMLLGIGMNGHIGFNEPNGPEDRYCTVLPLDDITKTVCVKYFDEVVNVTSGITLGMNHVKETKTVILIANALKKADIVKKTVEGEISMNIPSSLVRLVEDSVIYLDKEAGSKLER